MLNDAKDFSKIYLVTGYTDLRGGIDKLASGLMYRFETNPYEHNSIFLFCGRKSNKIKALVWEKDGFLLLYKRLENGSFLWPRNTNEVRNITKGQFDMLMKGFSVDAKIRIVSPKKLL